MFARFLALGVLAVGLSVTGVFSLQLARANRIEAAAELGDDAKILADLLETVVIEANGRTLGLQGLFAASEHVTEVEFREYSLRVGTSRGLQRLGFAHRVPHDELGSFLSQAQAERPEFSLRDNQSPDTAGAEPISYLIWYLVDFHEPDDIVGVDLSQTPNRQAAIDQALLSGEVALTELDGGCARGSTCEVMLFAPARDTKGTTGIVFVGVRLDQMLDSMIADDPETSLEWKLTDITEAAPDGDSIADPARWRNTLEVLGRLWRFEVIRNGGYDGLRAGNLWLFVVMGMAGSMLAAAATYLFSANRETRGRARRLHELHLERDRFLASLSHELRTPLTVVTGVVNILADRWAGFDRVELQELLDTADEQTGKLSDLIDDLLVVGRSESNTLLIALQEVDLVAEAARLVAAAVTDPGISMQISKQSAIAWTDPGRVRQILRNLIGNATRYATSAIRIDTELEDAEVKLLVRNDGPPISRHKVQHLFDAYSTQPTPGQPGPIGIGLHVSQMLAKAMNGHITYSYDGWVTFTLHLPRRPNPPQVSLVTRKRVPSAKGNHTS